MTFAELVFYAAMFVWGVEKTLQPGMIFGSLGDRIRTIKPEWIRKPLGTCIPCMSSVYGSLFYWSMYFTGNFYSESVVFLYICFVFIITGFNYFLICLID